ncbi:MAG: nuclear transport factor 2 family protein [Marmoricola sp.]
MDSDPAGFVADLVAAVNNHDIDALVACFAEGYLNETPVHPARAFAGPDQVRANWTTIFGAVPDIRASVPASAVDGDTIWTEWEIDGTRRDGSPHHMRGVMIFDVAERQATRVRFYLEPVDEGPADINTAVRIHVGQGGARP